jgi:hypothetical protein
MVEKDKVLSLLTEQFERLGRAVAKKQREMLEANDSCRGPQDSVDRGTQCACHLEFQVELNRLQIERVRYSDTILHVQCSGPVCMECGADISDRILKVPSTLCCECATEAEYRKTRSARFARKSEFLEF